MFFLKRGLFWCYVACVRTRRWFGALVAEEKEAEPVFIWKDAYFFFWHWFFWGSGRWIVAHFTPVRPFAREMTADTEAHYRRFNELADHDSKARPVEQRIIRPRVSLENLVDAKMMEWLHEEVVAVFCGRVRVYEHSTRELCASEAIHSSFWRTPPPMCVLPRHLANSTKEARKETASYQQHAHHGLSLGGAGNNSARCCKATRNKVKHATHPHAKPRALCREPQRPVAHAVAEAGQTHSRRRRNLVLRRGTKTQHLCVFAPTPQERGCRHLASRTSFGS